MTEFTARVEYQLEEADLSCLDYFEELGRYMVRMVRILRANDVRLLLHLKVATLAGIGDLTDARSLDWGVELAMEDGAGEAAGQDVCIIRIQSFFSRRSYANELPALLLPLNGHWITDSIYKNIVDVLDELFIPPAIHWRS
jgi:hypothetical protein